MSGRGGRDCPAAKKIFAVMAWPGFPGVAVAWLECDKALITLYFSC